MQDGEDRYSSQAKRIDILHRIIMLTTWLTTVSFPLAIVCAVIDDTTWLTFFLWMGFLLGFFGLLAGMMCNGYVHDYNGKSLFQELEREWQKKFKEVGLSLTTRFKIEVHGSGKRRSSTTYRWMEASYNKKRPRCDPEGSPSADEPCLKACCKGTVMLTLIIGSFIGCCMTPASIGLLNDYNSRTPGLCHFGSFSSSSGLPPTGYRCKASTARDTITKASYNIWVLIYTDVSHEPESGGAPETSRSKCEIPTYDEFTSEAECDAFGSKGRSSSIKCYLDGESQEGARLCKEGESESKWLVWGLLAYSVMSLCIASCGILNCCWIIWSDCCCPEFSVVAFVKGKMGKTYDDEDEDDESEAEDDADAAEKGETNQNTKSADDEEEEDLFNNATNDVNDTNNVNNDPDSADPNEAVTLPGAADKS